jgi:hypothetical protein
MPEGLPPSEPALWDGATAEVAVTVDTEWATLG